MLSTWISLVLSRYVHIHSFIDIHTLIVLKIIDIYTLIVLKIIDIYTLIVSISTSASYSVTLFKEN